LRLRECIAATHYFAPDAIPQLLDKMNSSSPVVKVLPHHILLTQIDTLQTLTACALNYGVTAMSTYAPSIWDAIRFEILNANDQDVSSHASDLLKAITRTLSFGLTEATPTSALGLFLKPITEVCIKELGDPEAKLAKPAGNVLATCSSVSRPSNKYILEKTIPVLVSSFQQTDSTNKRIAILDILNGFLDATVPEFEGDDPERTPIAFLRDDLFQVYSKGFLGSTAEETSYKLTALEGFRKLSELKGILSNNEIGIIIQYLNDVVLRDDNEET
jgi:DNA repair/transcription protein MET18/MMS19